jgi:hypothetical protein
MFLKQAIRISEPSKLSAGVEIMIWKRSTSADFGSIGSVSMRRSFKKSLIQLREHAEALNCAV